MRVFAARFAVGPKRFVLLMQKMFANCVRNSLRRESFVAVLASEFDRFTRMNFRVIARQPFSRALARRCNERALWYVFEQDWRVCKIVRLCRSRVAFAQRFQHV